MKKYLRIIVMASGLSRRFDENKLLVDVNGKPMITYVLENVVQFVRNHPEKGTGIVVSSYDEILRQASSMELKIQKNDCPEIGQSESIRLGLSYDLNHKEKVEEVAVFLTADQPFMKAQTLERFLLRALEVDAGFLCASNLKTPGSPVSFNERYFDELMELKGDKGGKVVMKRHLDQVVYFEIEANELKDVDSPKDLL